MGAKDIRQKVLIKVRKLPYLPSSSDDEKCEVEGSGVASNREAKSVHLQNESWPQHRPLSRMFTSWTSSKTASNARNTCPYRHLFVRGLLWRCMGEQLSHIPPRPFLYPHHTKKLTIRALAKTREKRWGCRPFYLALALQSSSRGWSIRGEEREEASVGECLEMMLG